MAENRRSFFASAASWLASLPLLSAWLARPAEASPLNPDGTPGRNVCVDYSSGGRSIGPAPGLWLSVKRDADHPFIPWKKVGEVGDDLAVIRWIPVTERLPEDVAGGWSKRVMLVMSDGGICFGHLIHVDPESRYRGEVIAEYGNPHWSVSDEGFSEKISAVTHWAELPALPATEGRL